MKIRFYSNFREDKRKSMNVVLSYLANNIAKDKKKHVAVFTPSFKNSKKKFLNLNWQLRYARYVDYPKQVKSLKNVDISHIIDHQYAHLVHQVNSNKKIITVHDLIPIIYQKKLKKNPYLVKYSLKHLKYFDKVIAVSNNTKRDIIKYTDCPSKKIVVLKSSVDKSFNNKKINKNIICQKYKIPINTKKILIVGSSFYKNHETSLKILENLKKSYKEKIILIKIGNKLAFKTPKNLKKILFEIKDIPRDKVNEIYKICDILLFPSIYEGYGLPCVEAINTELPIVSSNIKPLKEILGNYPLMFNSSDHKSMTNSIIKLLNNKKYYSEIKKKLKIRSKIFKETNYFKELEKIYNNC